MLLARCGSRLSRRARALCFHARVFSSQHGASLAHARLCRALLSQARELASPLGLREAGLNAQSMPPSPPRTFVTSLLVARLKWLDLKPRCPLSLDIMPLPAASNLFRGPPSPSTPSALWLIRPTGASSAPSPLSAPSTCSAALRFIPRPPWLPRLPQLSDLAAPREPPQSHGSAQPCNFLSCT